MYNKQQHWLEEVNSWRKTQNLICINLNEKKEGCHMNHPMKIDEENEIKSMRVSVI